MKKKSEQTAKNKSKTAAEITLNGDSFDQEGNYKGDVSDLAEAKIVYIEGCLGEVKFGPLEITGKLEVGHGTGLTVKGDLTCGILHVGELLPEEEGKDGEVGELSVEGDIRCKALRAGGNVVVHHIESEGRIFVGGILDAYSYRAGREVIIQNGAGKRVVLTNPIQQRLMAILESMGKEELADFDGGMEKATRMLGVLDVSVGEWLAGLVGDVGGDLYSHHGYFDTIFCWPSDSEEEELARVRRGAREAGEDPEVAVENFKFNKAICEEREASLFDRRVAKLFPAFDYLHLIKGWPVRRVADWVVTQGDLDASDKVPLSKAFFQRCNELNRMGAEERKVYKESLRN